MDALPAELTTHILEYAITHTSARAIAPLVCCEWYRCMRRICARVSFRLLACLAAHDGELDLVGYAQDAGCIVDKLTTACAAKSGHVDIVEYLLSCTDYDGSRCNASYRATRRALRGKSKSTRKNAYRRIGKIRRQSQAETDDAIRRLVNLGCLYRFRGGVHTKPGDECGKFVCAQAVLGGTGVLGAISSRFRGTFPDWNAATLAAVEADKPDAVEWLRKFAPVRRGRRQYPEDASYRAIVSNRASMIEQMYCDGVKFGMCDLLAAVVYQRHDMFKLLTSLGARWHVFDMDAIVQSAAECRSDGDRHKEWVKLTEFYAEEMYFHGGDWE